MGTAMHFAPTYLLRLLYLLCSCTILSGSHPLPSHCLTSACPLKFRLAQPILCCEEEEEQMEEWAKGE